MRGWGFLFPCPAAAPGLRQPSWLWPLRQHRLRPQLAAAHPRCTIACCQGRQAVKQATGTLLLRARSSRLCPSSLQVCSIIRYCSLASGTAPLHLGASCLVNAGHAHAYARHARQEPCIVAPRFLPACPAFCPEGCRSSKQPVPSCGGPCRQSRV